MTQLRAWVEFQDPKTGRTKSLELRDRVLSIGRTGGDLVLPEDVTLSAVHAVIAQEEDRFILRDLDSKSGTLVNGARVIETNLDDLDEILAGGTTLVFRVAERVRAPLINPFRMFANPTAFWTAALATRIFRLSKTWPVHLMTCAAIIAGALIVGRGGRVPFHGALLLTAFLGAFFLTTVTAAVFFAFESMSDASRRLSHAARFMFSLAPFLLTLHALLLLWAAYARAPFRIYVLAATIPTVAFCALVGLQAKHAFRTTAARGFAFAITASVPWNLLLTGLTSFIV